MLAWKWFKHRTMCQTWTDEGCIPPWAWDPNARQFYSMLGLVSSAEYEALNKQHIGHLRLEWNLGGCKSCFTHPCYSPLLCYMGQFWMKRQHPPPGSTDCASRKGIIQDSACIRHVFEVDHHAFCPGTTLQILWNSPHWDTGFDTTISIRPVFRKSELITPWE